VLHGADGDASSGGNLPNTDVIESTLGDDAQHRIGQGGPLAVGDLTGAGMAGSTMTGTKTSLPDWCCGPAAPSWCGYRRGPSVARSFEAGYAPDSPPKLRRSVSPLGVPPRAVEIRSQDQSAVRASRTARAIASWATRRASSALAAPWIPVVTAAVDYRLCIGLRPRRT
jgi:hypothetical protein